MNRKLSDGFAVTGLIKYAQHIDSITNEFVLVELRNFAEVSRSKLKFKDIPLISEKEVE